MPDPKQILNGEIKYNLEDFFNEMQDVWLDTGFKKEMEPKKKDEAFKSLFMFILLSSEDKPMSTMRDVYKIPEKQIKEMQEAFDKEIDVARHIQMRKFLDLYKHYQGGDSMTLKLLNLWIKDFLKKHIEKEDENGNA